jgi:uncharacterized damage-inducible protein DinB
MTLAAPSAIFPAMRARTRHARPPEEVPMRKMFAVLSLAALLVPAWASAQDQPAGIRGEMIASMQDAGSKIQELATAIPDGKYTWKPSKDVRSAGQVFLHVVQANYLLPSFFGVQPTMSKEELMKLDTQTMEPAKIRQMLTESYAWATKAIADTPDSDLETQVEFFGMKMSKRAAMLLLTSHSHEHLGQSIAYARSNNIVPPWTARELAEKKKKDAEKKTAEKSGK